MGLPRVATEGEASGGEPVATRVAVLEQVLRLLHPFTPFVTEELWQALPAAGRATGSIMTASYPRAEPSWRDAQVEEEIELLIEVVRAVRNIRAEMGIAPKTELDLYIGEGPAESVVRRHLAPLRRLARVARVSDGAVPRGCATAVAGATELSVPIAEHVDLDAEAQRLRKEIARIEKEITRLDRKLSNPAFREKAPASVVEQDEARLAESARDRQTLERSLEKVIAIGQEH